MGQSDNLTHKNYKGITFLNKYIKFRSQSIAGLSI